MINEPDGVVDPVGVGTDVGEDDLGREEAALVLGSGEHAQKDVLVVRVDVRGRT